MAKAALSRARTSDDALLASGFYQAYLHLANLIKEELDKQELQIKKTRENWNARRPEAGN